MTGTVLGHYEVLEFLGAGGMGEVYRARDTQLDRQGQTLRTLTEARAMSPFLALAPGGDRVAIGISEAERPDQHDLWLIDLGADAPKPFTWSEGVEYAPAWSSDGREVAFVQAGRTFDACSVMTADLDGVSLPQEWVRGMEPAFVPGQRSLVHSAHVGSGAAHLARTSTCFWSLAKARTAPRR